MSDEIAYYTPDTVVSESSVPANETVDVTASIADRFGAILDEMTFAELIQAGVVLADVVKDRADQERDRLVDQAKVVSAYLGVEPQALFEVKKPKTAKVIKFRHPEDAKKTWTGKGRQPDWVKELVSAGTPLESLAA